MSLPISDGNVTSIMMMFFVLSETRRISDLRVVLTMCFENISCFFRSTERGQSWAIARVPIVSCPWLLPYLDISNCVTAAADPLADGFSNRFQHVVMAPGILDLAKCRSSGCAPVFLLVSTVGNLGSPPYPR